MFISGVLVPFGLVAIGAVALALGVRTARDLHGVTTISGSVRGLSATITSPLGGDQVVGYVLVGDPLDAPIRVCVPFGVGDVEVDPRAGKLDERARTFVAALDDCDDQPGRLSAADAPATGGLTYRRDTLAIDVGEDVYAALCEATGTNAPTGRLVEHGVAVGDELAVALRTPRRSVRPADIAYLGATPPTRRLLATTVGYLTGSVTAFALAATAAGVV